MCQHELARSPRDQQAINSRAGCGKNFDFPGICKDEHEQREYECKNRYRHQAYQRRCDRIKHDHRSDHKQRCQAGGQPVGKPGELGVVVAHESGLFLNGFFIGAPQLPDFGAEVVVECRQRVACEPVAEGVVLACVFG